MTNFKNKVALVTGGSSGMGAATAHQLANKGAKVFCAQRTESLHEDIITDLKDIDAPKNIISELSKKTDKLDILINNAGVMKENTVEETSLDEWNEHLTINLTVPFLLIKHSMYLLKKSRGSIVNVGSIEGKGNNPGHSAYGASKAGLHGLTLSLIHI